jgi:RHS repeat-associated protein
MKETLGSKAVRAMGVWALTALVLAVAPAAGSPAATSTSQEPPAPPSTSDRVPTRTPTDAYPRWLPISNLSFQKMQTGDPDFSGSARDIAVDPRGVVHVAALGYDNSQNGQLSLFYANNRWETRRIHGFSPFFKIRGHPESPENMAAQIRQIRIAAAPNGRVAICWEESDILDAEPWFVQRTFVRVYDPAVGWQPQVEMAVTSSSASSGTVFGNPFLLYDASSNLNMILMRRDYLYENYVLVSDVRKILRSVNLGAFEAVVTRTAVPLDPQGFPELQFFQVGPFISVDALGRAQYAWLNKMSTWDEGRIRHRSVTGSEADISGTLQNIGWGFVGDRFGNAHFAYNDGMIQYRRREASGALGAAEEVPMPGENVNRDPAIDVDVQGKPHVMWTSQDSIAYQRQAAYAKRVGDPLPQDSPWALQYPIAMMIEDGDPHDLHGGAEPRIRAGCQVFCVGEAVHVFFPSSGAEYTRTIEYNLGEQDAFAAYPAGPNTTANAVTGNLMHRLPVFASRGAGWATSFSLVYNSQHEVPGPLSIGWTHPYNLLLTRTTSWYGGTQPDFKKPHTVQLGDGRTVLFTFDENRGFHLARDEFGFFARLEVGWWGSVMTDKFGTQYNFLPDGKVWLMADSNGNWLRLDYGPNPASMQSERSLAIPETVLTGISDTMYRETTFRFDAEERIAEVTDPAGGSYRIQYENLPEGNLAEVRFASAPAETVWRYAYHANDEEAEIEGVPDAYHRRRLMASFTTPKGAKYDFCYRLDGRVRAAQEPQADHVNEAGGMDSGRVRTVFTYLDQQPGMDQKIAVQNRRGFTTTIKLEHRRCLALEVTDPDGFTVQREFDAVPNFRNLLKFTDKRGTPTRYTYYPRESSVPDWVGDNLQTIVRRDGPSAPGTVDLPPITYTYTADGLNRVASVTDARGALTLYEYDTRGNLARITYPAALTVTATGPGPGTPTVSESMISVTEGFGYDGRGRITWSRSANGGLTSYQYNDPVTGLVTGIRRPEHTNAEGFAYDRLGNTVQHTLPLGGQTTFHLDGIYRVEYQIAPSGDIPNPTTWFFYTLDSEVESVKNPRGYSTTHAIDILGRVVSTTNARGETTRFYYDRERNARITEDPLGAQTLAEFDGLNRMVLERRPGPPSMEVVLGYDPNGNLKTRTDMPGRVTAHEYDARNNLRRTTHPLAALVDEFRHDANDNPILSMRKHAGAFKYGTHTAFDARNRARSVTSLDSDPGPGGGTISGLTTVYGTDGDGNRRYVKDPRDYVTAFSVDLADRQTEAIDAKGVRVSKTLYTDNDLVEAVRVQPPEGVAPGPDGLVLSRFHSYNARNELKTTSDYFGHEVVNSYDANSNVVTTRDEMGVIKEFTPDSLDRVEFTRVPVDPGRVAETRFTYDARGNRDSVTDPMGRVYRFEHDAAGRLIALVYPPIVTGPQPGPSHVEGWSYNAHGEMETHTDALGEVAVYGYDAMGRLETEAHTLGGLTRAAIVRTYDGASNLISVTDSVSGLAVEYVDPLGLPGYDPHGRLTDVRWRVLGTVFRSLHYTYDPSSNRETMTGPDGEVTVYTHDPNSRPETLKRNGSLLAAWIYDDGGRLKETALGNGTKILRVYDGKEQAQSVSTVRGDGTLLAGYGYAYNARGERTGMAAEHLGIAVAYGYFQAGWLKSETYSGALSSVRTYDYDLNGNRRLAVRDGVAYSYYHDEENRLYLEESGEGTGGQLEGTPVVSSTRYPRSPAILADGVTEDRTEVAYAWRNEGAPIAAEPPVWAGLDFGVARPVEEVRFFIPTLDPNPAGKNSPNRVGMRRFKVQVGDGVTFQDVEVTALVGCETAPEAGWLRTPVPAAHEIRVKFTCVTARVARVLMDLGSEAQPEVMWANEVQAFGPGVRRVEYFYDANGNQIRRVEGGTEELFGFDYRNALVSYVSRRVGETQPLAAWGYEFMPGGERLGKMDILSGRTVWSMSDGADAASDYVTTPSNPVWTLEMSYVNGLSIDSKVARIDASGARHFYVTDALGSATELVNDAQGIANSYFTTAWGEDLINQRPVPDRYGFTQRERDDESGLVHFRARSYDPRLGRFIQTDPALDGRAAEHYVYVRNRPTQTVDPTGFTLEVAGKQVTKESDFYKQHAKISVFRSTFLEILIESKTTYKYTDQSIIAEMEFRDALLAAADKVKKSGLGFAAAGEVGKDVKGWEGVKDGIRFKKGSGLTASKAIEELFNQAKDVKLDCANGGILVFYEALRSYLGDERFDKLFVGERQLDIAQANSTRLFWLDLKKYDDYLPGDWRYFSNPNLDPKESRAWQGFNAIQAGKEATGKFIAHPGFELTAQETIDKLNSKTSVVDERGTRAGGASLDKDARRFDFDKIFKYKIGD